MKNFPSLADVASHNKPDDLYIVIDEEVYDVSKFQDEHPGGKKSMSLFDTDEVTSVQC